MLDAILVDDHALLRRGLRDLLTDTKLVRVIAEAADYAQWSAISRTTQYDLLVLDINLPGRSGMDILKAALERSPGMRVLVYSQLGEEQFGVRAIKAGAMSYLRKDADIDTIRAAIRALHSRKPYITPEIENLMIDSLRKKSPANPHQALSERELQTMLRIAKGEKRAQIAKSLSLSPKTVSVYRARIMQKLGATSDAAIAAYAVRHQLVV